MESGIKDPEDKVNHRSCRVLAAGMSEHELMNRSLKLVWKANLKNVLNLARQFKEIHSLINLYLISIYYFNCSTLQLALKKISHVLYNYFNGRISDKTRLTRLSASLLRTTVQHFIGHVWTLFLYPASLSLLTF